MEYSLAVDDEDYDDKLPAQWWEEEDEEEDENLQEEKTVTTFLKLKTTGLGTILRMVGTDVAD